MKKLKVLISVIVSAVTLALLFTNILMSQYQIERERSHYIALNEMEQIITTIDCVMARTYTLQALVEDHQGDLSFFDRVAGKIYDAVLEETGVELRNIALAPKGVVEKVYPLSGNESLIGFDFMDPNRPGNEEAIEAYNSGKAILTNPFELVQGGKGIAGRAPVMIGEGRDKRLWGLITVTIDYDKFMKTLGLSHFSNVGYNFELSFKDSEGKENIMEKEGELGNDTVDIEFKIRNLDWIIKLEPQNGWIPTYMIIAVIIISAIITLLIGLLVNAFTRVKESNHKLKLLSYRDGLTSVYSRHYVNTVLVDMQNGSWNDSEMKYSLIIIDIDDFKQFNDNYGHDVGDRVIYSVARALANNIKENCGDCVIRFGGDEFVVLLNDVTRERLKDITDAFVADVHMISFDDINGLRVSISGGAAFYEDCEDKSYNAMTKVADDKLYMAKEKGKDQIQL